MKRTPLFLLSAIILLGCFTGCAGTSLQPGNLPDQSSADQTGTVSDNSPGESPAYLRYRLTISRKALLQNRRHLCRPVQRQHRLHLKPIIISVRRNGLLSNGRSIQARTSPLRYPKAGRLTGAAIPVSCIGKQGILLMKF